MSIWRGLKIDQGETDVCAAAQWSTGVFDVDAFQPGSANDSSGCRTATSSTRRQPSARARGLFLGVRAAAKALYDEDDLGDETDENLGSRDENLHGDVRALRKDAVSAVRLRAPRDPSCHGRKTCVFYVFRASDRFLCASAAAPVWAVVGWAWYMFMVCHVVFIRNATRHDRGIYGNGWEDLFASVCMYPAIVSQLELHAADDAAPRRRLRPEQRLLRRTEAYATARASFHGDTCVICACVY